MRALDHQDSENCPIKLSTEIFYDRDLSLLHHQFLFRPINFPFFELTFCHLYLHCGKIICYWQWFVAVNVWDNELKVSKEREKCYGLKDLWIFLVFWVMWFLMKLKLVSVFLLSGGFSVMVTYFLLKPSKIINSDQVLITYYISVSWDRDFPLNLFFKWQKI